MILGDVPVGQAAFACPYSYDVEGSEQELHVFALTITGSPQYLNLPDTEESRSNVAAMVRAGLVVAVVLGKKVRYTVDSVVTLSGDNASQHSSLILSSEISNA